MSDKPPPPDPPADSRFHTTQWSLVLAAGDRQRADSTAALAQLCQTYWFPVYAFVRRRVADRHQAQDLTQEFFAQLLEKDYLARARRERGRFRSFMLTAVQRFLGHQWAKAKRLKRGGGRTILSLDFEWGESRMVAEPADDQSPERAFDRQWALQLLDVVQRRLGAEYAAGGRQALFERLKPLLIRGGQEQRYDVVAADLGMTPGAVRTAVYRMRRRYRELVRSEIAQTVAGPEEVDDEVQRLFEALG